MKEGPDNLGEGQAGIIDRVKKGIQKMLAVPNQADKEVEFPVPKKADQETASPKIKLYASFGDYMQEEGNEAMEQKDLARIALAEQELEEFGKKRDNLRDTSDPAIKEYYEKKIKGKEEDIEFLKKYHFIKPNIEKNK